MRSHKFHDPQLAKMAAVAAQLGATMDAYTGTGSVTTAKPAYDQLIYFALRPQLYFDACADVEPTRQAMPGSTVIFTIFNDLAPATTPLSQTSDVTAVALSDSQVTVALAEYGNAVITTAKLRGESFVDITPAVVNILGYNAGVSIDEIARNVLSAGSNVRYSTGGTTTTVVPVSRTQVTAACLIKGKTVRSVVARLRTYNVPTIGAGYVSYIHPNVSVDLRQTTGPAGWRDPHIYSQPGEIWTGEIGMFEGARFMETPRARVFPTGGASTVPVYQTYFMGRQALAKCHSIVDGNGPFPQARRGPIVDKLRRFVPDGWYWLGNYGLFRQASLDRVESASSQTYSQPTIDD